ncbi:hypothetical protein GYMLUDRAFT_46910 [Collybiopsis luxurians FD-317 M1]|uniref:Uncharacterized protein n=1 Tax=Collybiopsis luxurians FD-317 M1 TaxID=944289 RepID=A0A0D0CMV3_9AGAR|nr:hypothetical protein GYMLUDRAFT_46910 [Collybiopsis luxurians FD-317 M1]
MSKTETSATNQPQSPPKLPRSPSSPSFKHKPPAISTVASSLLSKVRRSATALSPIHSHSRRPSEESESSSEEERDKAEEGTRTEGTRAANPITSSPQSMFTLPTTPTKNRRARSSTWTCSSSELPPLTRTSSDSQKERVECKDTFVCTGGVNLPLLLRLTKARLFEDAENRAGIGMGFGGGKKIALDSERWTCTISGPPPLIPTTLSPPTSPRFPSPQPTAAPATSPPATSRSSSLPTSPFSSPGKPRRRDSGSTWTGKANSTGSSTSLANRKYKVHIHYAAYATVVDTTSTSPVTPRTPDYHQPVELDRAKEGSVRGLMTIVSRKEPGS